MKLSTLIIKSFLGLVFLLCIMSAALFVPYGSFSYNLAWLYLSVFTVSVLGITVYLFLFDKHSLKSKLTAGPVAETRLIQKIIRSIAELSFIGIFILPAFDYKNNWSSVPLQISYGSDFVCTLASSANK